MQPGIFLRIWLALLLLVGVFLLPYWPSIAFGAVLAVLIPFYFEFAALVVVEEMLYHGAGLAGTNMLYPLSLFAFFILLEVVRTLTRERFLRI